MKVIADLVEKIDKELEGAKEYAEMFVTLKADDKSSWANTFKEMANQELQHANNVHEYAKQEIERINKVYKAPVEMQEAWDKAHKLYIERASWIKQMLSM